MSLPFTPIPRDRFHGFLRASGAARGLLTVVLGLVLAGSSSPQAPLQGAYRVLDPVSEDAATRRIEVLVGNVAEERGPADEARSLLRPIDPDSTAVTGRLVFRDRLYDASGYTGALQTLPARGVALELRTLNADSLVVFGRTDADGRFDLRSLAVDDTMRLVLRASAQTEGGGIVRVVDAAGVELLANLGSELTVPAGFEADLADLFVDDGPADVAARAVHLLDLSSEAVAWVERDLGPWPAAVPAVRYDVGVADLSTGVLGDGIVVSSPAAGRDDAWSDGRVLAAWGARLAFDLGGVAPGSLDFDEVTAPAVDAFRRATAWAFAAAVQAERIERRSDALGGPLAVAADLLIDLPAAPPPGIPVPAESALEIEDGTIGFDARPVLPRGQRAAPVLATLLHDTADGLDDDPVDGSRADFLPTVVTVLSEPAATYEDFHAAWIADFGDPAGAFTARARDVAAVAIEVDAFEPDDTPATATEFTPWVQPPPTFDAVVISEIYVGEVDGVELHNTSAAPIDLSSWTVRAQRDGFANLPSRTVTLPEGAVLRPGRAMLVLEGTSSNRMSPFDLPAPDWNVPWAANTDGAVVLRRADSQVVDFVRWGGSTEPAPGGTGFTGVLDAVVDERLALARDVLGTDTGTAGDFLPRSATPGWPNLEPVRVHTLGRDGDLDHLRVPADGPVEIVARRQRDEGTPRIRAIDGIVPTGAGLGRDSAGALASITDSTVVVLETAEPAATSTGLHVFAWRPFAPVGPFPVEGLEATVAGAATTVDTVRVRWTAPIAPDSLRVFENGQPIASVGPAVSGLDLVRSLGAYTYRVEPVVGGLEGPSRSTRVFVGPTLCEADYDFQTSPGLADPLITFFRDTNSPVGLDGAVLRDTPLGAPSYANSDTARATFASTFAVDLRDSLRIEHAVHLAGDGDRAFVEVSVDDGLTWTVIGAWDGTERAGGSGAADWTDGSLTQQDIVEDVLDLSDFAGQRIRLRLRRASDASGTSLGWTVDRIALEKDDASGLVVVAPDGSDVIGCGTARLPYAQPGFAAAQARPGETVVLAAGDYVLDPFDDDTAVRLPAGVALVGAGPDAVRLQVPDGIVGVAVSDPAAEASLSGLTLSGGSIAVHVVGTSLSMQNVRLLGADTGLDVRGGRATLDGTLIADAGIGVSTAGGAAVDAVSSTFADLGSGVLVTSAADTVTLRSSGFARCTGSAVATVAAGAVVTLECVAGWDIGLGFLGAPPQLLTPLLELDPLHCDPVTGDYTVAESSPWLDDPTCGPLGGVAEGCATIVTDAPSRPSKIHLRAPHPNPFNPRTTIEFRLPVRTDARVEIFDVRGRRVAILLDESRGAGVHRLVWTGTDDAGATVASGVYYVRLRAATEQRTQRMVLVR